MASLLQAMKLDVLIFAEIGMDPVNYLLAFARLAPVQVVTHGVACNDSVYIGDAAKDTP